MPNPDTMYDQQPGIPGNAYPNRRWHSVRRSIAFTFSDRWEIDRVIAIVRAHPRVTAPRLAVIECGRALDRLADGETLVEPPDDPQSWMLDRVKLYAQSPAGRRGIYVPESRRFFFEDMFAADPRTWQVNDDGTEQRVNAAKQSTERVIQERQEKQRQEAARLAAEKAEQRRILDAMTDEQVEQCRQRVLGWVASFQKASLARQNPRGNSIMANLVVAEFRKMQGGAA